MATPVGGAIGVSFDPSQAAQTGQSGNGGGFRVASPNSDVNVLSLRIPKMQAPTSIAALPLLTSHSAMGAHAVDPQFLSLLSRVLGRQIGMGFPGVSNAGGGVASGMGALGAVVPGTPPSALAPPRVVVGANAPSQPGPTQSVAPTNPAPPAPAPGLPLKYQDLDTDGNGGFFSSILQGGSVPGGSLY